MKFKVLFHLIIYFALCISLYPSYNGRLHNDHHAADCIKETVRKHYYFYKNGIDKSDYFSDVFTIYTTSQYFKMDSPVFDEILIYDDHMGIITYLLTDKKVYMSVNPEKEPLKRRSEKSMTENHKFWNTGIKAKHGDWNIEVWRDIRYGTKESKIGMIDTFSYITRELSYPKAYFNFYNALEKTYTLNLQSSTSPGIAPGPTVWSITTFYNKSMILQYIAIEELIDIQYINSDDSLFEIPKNYREVEWNPDLFKH
jgi:hypothetical protein